MTLVAFSWGYEGWGGSTTELVEVAAEVERARGYAPPLFVDIRLRRQVRAPGFRDRAFEQLLGPGYEWMRGLGNRGNFDPELTKVTIDDPAQADVLLDRIEAHPGRRVIFFCACGSPGKHTNCHRLEVGRLLLKRAQARGLGLSLQEWPGGAPVRSSLFIERAELKEVRRSRTSFSLPQHVPVAVAAALPHFSMLRLFAEDDGLIVLSGAAFHQAGRWRLPVYDVFELDDERAALTTARSSRRELRLTPRGARPASPPAAWSSFVLGPTQGLHPEAVYAIRHPELLARSEQLQADEFVERKRWTGAHGLLRRAERPVPILFADATNCSRLTHWGILRAAAVHETSTTVRVSDVRRLPRMRTPQELVLLSTRRPIAPDFIRSYALVETPAFLPQPR